MRPASTLQSLRLRAGESRPVSLAYETWPPSPAAPHTVPYRTRPLERIRTSVAGSVDRCLSTGLRGDFAILPLCRESNTNKWLRRPLPGSARTERFCTHTPSCTGAPRLRGPWCGCRCGCRLERVSAFARRALSGSHRSYAGCNRVHPLGQGLVAPRPERHSGAVDGTRTHPSRLATSSRHPSDDRVVLSSASLSQEITTRGSKGAEAPKPRAGEGYVNPDSVCQPAGRPRRTPPYFSERMPVAATGLQRLEGAQVAEPHPQELEPDDGAAPSARSLQGSAAC